MYNESKRSHPVLVTLLIALRAVTAEAATGFSTGRFQKTTA